VPRGARFAEDFRLGRERFLRRGGALAIFRHPHIVPVLRYFEAKRHAYTVMEFEDGKSVGELLRQPAGRLVARRRAAPGRRAGRRPQRPARQASSIATSAVQHHHPA